MKKCVKKACSSVKNEGTASFLYYVIGPPASLKLSLRRSQTATMTAEIPVDPTSLKALRGLCGAYPSLSKRWQTSTAVDGILGDFGPPPPAQTAHTNANDTTATHWSSMAAFDDNGVVTGLDLGGLRLKSLNPALLSDLSDSLITLNFANTDLPLTEEARSAITQLGKLEVLCLGGNGINDANIDSVVEIAKCSKSLAKLDLRYNDLGPKGIQALCKAIAEGQCDQLSCIHLEGNKIGDDGCQCLAEVLSKSNISELYLGDNGIGPAGAAHFPNALAKSDTKLENLFLEGNQIKAEGAEALAVALEGLWAKSEGNAGIALKHLYCDNNGVGKEGMKRLALALRSPTAVGDSL